LAESAALTGAAGAGGPAAPRPGEPEAGYPQTGRRRRPGWVPYVLLAPSVAYLAVFFVLPLLQGLRLAFTGQDGQWGLVTVHQLLGDPGFWSSLWNTLIMLAIILPVQLVLALAMSLLVNARLRGSAFWFYVYMLPLGISDLTSGIIWYSVFTQQGWLNSVLQGLGIIHQPYIWLSYQHQLLIIATIVVAEAWRSTSIIVIILVGGLQSIPREYLEAADVFYASPWQKLWHVTLPLLRPTLRTALILRTVLAFEVFATVIALAGSSLSVLATKANNAYTQFQEPHLAAAYGILIMLLSLVSTAVFLVTLPVRTEQAR
jgi:multiple sugar transport system permease protein